jgi:hypothetical protein
VNKIEENKKDNIKPDIKNKQIKTNEDKEIKKETEDKDRKTTNNNNCNGDGGKTNRKIKK